MHAEANALALAHIHAVRPQWCDVATAGDAVALPDMTLLHAGPPFADPCKPSEPVLASAALCCVYEGWAGDVAHAERLIAAGTVRLESAQSYGVVAPLAAVISPRTSLVEVADARHPAARAWSLLGSGTGPQIRFGTRNVRVIDRLRWRDTVLAPALRAALAQSPIDLIPIAQTALDHGDDLHARTHRASAELQAALAPHLHDADVLRVLAETPLFFLTLWMASCHLMLSAASGTSASTLVVAMAGNGERVGIRLAGMPTQWFTAEGTSPQGPRIDPTQRADIARVTGDSGVIDIAGFGAQAFGTAPEPAEALAAFLPVDRRALQGALQSAAHPCFPTLPGVVDAARVVAAHAAPIAAIAMIGADGASGLLGRGIYTAPADLFACALRAFTTQTG